MNVLENYLFQGLLRKQEMERTFAGRKKLRNRKIMIVVVLVILAAIGTLIVRQTFAQCRYAAEVSICGTN